MCDRVCLIGYVCVSTRYVSVSTCYVCVASLLVLSWCATPMVCDPNINLLCLRIDSLCPHNNVGPSNAPIDLLCVYSGLHLRDFKASALVRATQTTFYAVVYRIFSFFPFLKASTLGRATHTTFYRYTNYMLLNTTPKFHAVV